MEWPEARMGPSTQCPCSQSQVDKVLNHRYSPVPGSDEEEVFEKMQGHMYTVFVRLVEETKGLRIVKEHKSDRDAQTIYKKLSDYYAGEARRWQLPISMRWRMESSIMDGEIPEPRRQPLLLSMQKWRLKVDDFNSLAPPGRYINDAQTLVHLKRFIKNVPELQDINNMVDIMSMCTGLQNNGHTPSSLDKIQMYFNVATRVDKGVKS